MITYAGKKHKYRVYLPRKRKYLAGLIVGVGIIMSKHIYIYKCIYTEYVSFDGDKHDGCGFLGNLLRIKLSNHTFIVSLTEEDNVRDLGH